MPRQKKCKELQVKVDEKDVAVVDEKGYTIIVTGTPKFVAFDSLSPNGEITFDQVVELDDRSPPLGTPDIVYFITYENAIGRRPRPSGPLTEGEVVKIQNETEFTVRYDNKS